MEGRHLLGRHLLGPFGSRNFNSALSAQCLDLTLRGPKLLTESVSHMSLAAQLLCELFNFIAETCCHSAFCPLHAEYLNIQLQPAPMATLLL